MAIEIVMPKLGWTMEDGILDEWVKADGDAVEPGDVIFVVESDKALQEIEAFDSGILRIRPDAPPVGSVIPIGELLAYLVQPGETAPFEAQDSDAPEPPAEEAPAVVESTPRDQPAPAPRTKKIAISPRAKRIAAELGVDFTPLEGSGASGRIVERDIRAAHASQVTTTGSVRRQPLSPIRQLTRDRMAESARTAAPVTLSSEVDATEIVMMRGKLRADGNDIVPSITDLIAKLTATALTEHPTLNASIDGDDILYHDSINIGIAVEGERGLIVPVIHNAAELTLLELAAASAQTIPAARHGKASPEQLRGATFTISNLGMYDIDAFTPIVSLPQCAVLGVGRIVPRQIVVDADRERLAIRQMMTLSLTFDHRVVDGAPAARFLQRIKQYVETPYLWLVS